MEVCMEPPSLGDLELEVLRYIADRAPVTAREVAEGYGQGHGLAKTTVLTVIDRLRRKKYLTRKRREGLFYYTPRVPKNELLQKLVQEFVGKVLAGSVSPVFAYLAHGHPLTESDLDELQHLVEALKAKQSAERKE